MKVWLKALLITLGSVAGLVMVLVIILVVSSKGTILTGGVPLGGVKFTAGNIEGVPVYPGAEQLTDNEGVSVPDDMRRVIGSKEDQWKRYVTDDEPQAVKDWYAQAMVDAGFTAGAPRESGILIFPTGDTRYAVFVTVVEGRTNIIVAAGKE